MEDPLLGTVLQDRYRIVRKIGEGGMGAVYEGEHTLIKRRVAIKVLHGQLAQNAEIVARFHKEALAATSIGNEHIVEVTDMGRMADGALFMVLEFLDGRDWDQEIERNGPQPLGRVVHIMDQVCEALTEAHAKGIIHRDLKPENVYLIERGGDPYFAKVLDFGISKFKGPEGGANKSMTQTGTTLGTPYYMAPEQAQAKKDIDHRADIYSLGVMFFQALTGQYPFDDESYPMLVLKICTSPPPPLRMYRPDLPEELELVLGRMLAKSPLERFENCEALRGALAPYRTVSAAPVMNAAAQPTASMGQGLMLAASGIQQRAQAESMAGAPAGAAMNPSGGTPMPLANTNYQPPGSSRMPLFIGAGVLTVVALAVGLLFATGMVGAGNQDATPPPVATPTSTPPTTLTPPTTPTPTAPTVPITPTTPTGVATPVATVTVQINTTPEDAELYLDGNRIPNPFDGELPSSTDVKRLEARRSGYRTIVQDLVLQFAQRVRLTMHHGLGTDDRRSQATRAQTPTIDAPAMVQAPVMVETSALVPTPVMMQAPVPAPAMVEAPAMTQPAAMVEVQEPRIHDEPPPTMHGHLKQIF